MTTLDRIVRSLRELTPPEARVVMRVVRLMRSGGDDSLAAPVREALDYEREMEVRR